MGHTYIYELEFEFNEIESIGYAIDFKEIKRVACQWIDDMLDHGMILNPQDTKLIETTKTLGSKLWLMSLNGEEKYCNPSVENIAKEIFLAMEILFNSYDQLRIHKIVLWETPNCFTTCLKDSISSHEEDHFYVANGETIGAYAKAKGIVIYDDRKS